MKRKLIAMLVAIMAMSSVSSVAFAAAGKVVTGNVKTLTKTQEDTEDIKEVKVAEKETATDAVKVAMDTIVAENAKIKVELEKITKAISGVIAYDNKDATITAVTSAKKVIAESQKVIEASMKIIDEQGKTYTAE